MFKNIYRGKRVLLTGHTGFKGSWLSLWLERLGADVVGYSLDIPTRPSHFELLDLKIRSITADVLDRQRLITAIEKHEPEIVFHLAAQSLVRRSYADPVATFETNVMRKDTGTWLGGVRWGFYARLAGIVSEWAELSLHVSDTFTAALDRFAKVFRNPHRAMQGDTLRSLAARFLGNPDRWAEIASLNPALKTLTGTDQVPVGTMVEVPEISPDKP